jgi:hypothetical protein
VIVLPVRWAGFLRAVGLSTSSRTHFLFLREITLQGFPSGQVEVASSHCSSRDHEGQQQWHIVHKKTCGGRIDSTFRYALALLSARGALFSNRNCEGDVLTAWRQTIVLPECRDPTDAGFANLLGIPLLPAKASLSANPFLPSRLPSIPLSLGHNKSAFLPRPRPWKGGCSSVLALLALSDRLVRDGGMELPHGAVAPLTSPVTPGSGHGWCSRCQPRQRRWMIVSIS